MDPAVLSPGQEADVIVLLDALRVVEAGRERTFAPRVPVSRRPCDDESFRSTSRYSHALFQSNVLFVVHAFVSFPKVQHHLPQTFRITRSSGLDVANERGADVPT